MKKIINAFALIPDNDEYCCFGCSPANKDGLQLNFVDKGDYIESEWSTLKKFEGFLNVLHGGIQATLLDETAAWVVFAKCGTAGVTKTLNVEYLSAVYISYKSIKLVGRLVKQKEKEALIECELINPEGKVCAKAEVVYFLFPESIAKRKYHYPGLKAFYNE